METLVVESTLDSESQKLGWIIPLPAVPEVIEKESPGLLKTLSFCVQPRITHDPVPGLPTVVLCALIANLLLGVALFSRHKTVEVIGIVVVLSVLAALGLPAVSRAYSATARPSSVRQEKTARVGAYEITVLSSGNAADLDSWLEQNGFAPLPPEAAGIIAQYVREGWVFAAIRLVREETGQNSPHPLKMAFRTQEAVYPLKLTSIAGGSTHFELFAISDKRVSCDLLHEEFCDRFSADNDLRRYPDPDYETQDAYKGAATEIRIGHPGVCALMWDGCVLTKFSGAVPGTKMTRDLRMFPRRFAVHQEHLFTRNGAGEVALMFAAGLLGVAVLVTMPAFRSRIRQPQGTAWYARRVVMPSVAVSACCGGVLFLALPKLAASEVTLTHGLWAFRIHQALAMVINEEVSHSPDVVLLPSEQMAERLRTNALARLHAHWSGKNPRAENPITGTSILIEDSPGNFTVVKNETNVVIRVYNLSGRPLIQHFPLPPPGHGPD